MNKCVFTNPEKAKLHIFLIVICIICWFEWLEIFKGSDKSSLTQTIGGKGMLSTTDASVVKHHMWIVPLGTCSLTLPEAGIVSAEIFLQTLWFTLHNMMSVVESVSSTAAAYQLPSLSRSEFS